jgi:hypothetical protein
MNVEIEIQKLKQHAKEHGLKVRFRDHTTPSGDFCIFIYDKTYRNSYAVGFDGCWGLSNISFDKCLKSAYNWIDKRDKRFEKINGVWKVKEEYKEKR